LRINPQLTPEEFEQEEVIILLSKSVNLTGRNCGVCWLSRKKEKYMQEGNYKSALILGGCILLGLAFLGFF
jgi:hypothetical protein